MILLLSEIHFRVNYTFIQLYRINSLDNNVLLFKYYPVGLFLYVGHKYSSFKGLIYNASSVVFFSDFSEL